MGEGTNNKGCLGRDNTNIKQAIIPKTWKKILLSTSAIVAAASVNLISTPAQAACVTVGGVVTCTGDLSGGILEFSALIDTLNINTLNANIGDNGVLFQNTDNLDVTVNADLGAFNIVTNPGVSLNTRNGFNILTDGSISGTLDGNVTGSLSDDVLNPVFNTVSLFGAIGLDAGAGIDFTHTGSINVSLPTVTVIDTSRSDVVSGRFAAVRVESDEGDVVINNTGAIDLVAGTRVATTANVTEGAAGARAVQFDNGFSESHGILAQGNGDLIINQIGNITISGNGAQVSASTDNNISEGKAEFSDARGITVPAYSRTAGVFDPDLPRFEDIDITVAGDISVTGGDIDVTAIANSTGPAEAQGTAIADAGRFIADEAIGINVGESFNGNGSSITVDVTGDITVNGGAATATATASLGGAGEVAGLIIADADGQESIGIQLRGDIGENLDAIIPIDLTVNGDITVNGGTATATGTSAGEGQVQRNTLYNDQPDFESDQSVNAFGGIVTGVSTSIGGNSNLDINGVVRVSGGDATVTATGSENIRASAIGAQATGISAVFLEEVPNNSFTLDTEVILTGANATVNIDGTGLKGSAQARGGTGVVVTSVVESTFIQQADITATGGDAVINVSNGAEVSDIIGGFGGGLAFTPFAEGGISGTAIIEGTIQVTGGDTAINGAAVDPNIRALGGGALGVFAELLFDGATATVEHNGTIIATAGNGPNGRGAAAGIISFDQGFFSDATTNGIITVTGDIQVDGEGVEDDIFILTNSGGVIGAHTGKTTIEIDGGTISTTGDKVNGVSTHSTNAEVTVKAGSTITTNGTGSDGIQVRARSNINNSTGETDIFLNSTTMVTIDSGAVVTANNAAAVKDVSSGFLVGSDPDTGLPLTTELAVANMTTLDLAGTVTGGGGTAIDLGSGSDKLILRPTAQINGETTLGDGVDRLDFELGFTTTGRIDGGAGDDIIEANVGGGATRILDLAPLPFDGFEVIEKTGDGTLTVTSTPMSGPITLQANGGISDTSVDLPGLNVIVNNGGIFDATNIVGSITTQGTGMVVGIGTTGDLINNGILAPGNSIGILTVNGDLTLGVAGRLDIEIDSANNSDLINVSGQTTVGGDLNVIATGMLNAFSEDNTYTIINSTGGLTGSFATITDNLPDLDVEATVNANSVDLSLTLGPQADDSDRSLHTNTMQAAGQSARLFSQTLENQTRSLSKTDSDRRYTVWGDVIGSTAKVNGGGGVNGYKANTTGLATGFGMRFDGENGGKTRIGAGLGFDRTSVNNGLSSADIDSWNIGAYVSHENGALILSSGIGYGFQDYELTRILPIVGAAPVIVWGKANGNVFDISTSASYDIAEKVGISDEKNIRLAPVVRLDHVSVKRDGFTETGGGILNQSVVSNTYSRTWLGAGVQFSKTIKSSNGGTVWRPELELRYDRSFGDKRAVTRSSFSSVPGAALSTIGVLEGRNIFAIEAGVSASLTDSLSINFQYDGAFASGTNIHTGNARISWKF